MNTAELYRLATTEPPKQTTEQVEQQSAADSIEMLEHTAWLKHPHTSRFLAVLENRKRDCQDIAMANSGCIACREIVDNKLREAKTINEVIKYVRTNQYAD